MNYPDTHEHNPSLVDLTEQFKQSRNRALVTGVVLGTGAVAAEAFLPRPINRICAGVLGMMAAAATVAAGVDHLAYLDYPGGNQDPLERRLG